LATLGIKGYKALRRDRREQLASVCQPDGDPIPQKAIMDAAEIPELAAEDLQVILAGRRFDFDSAAMGEETEFSSDGHYQEKGVYHSEWASESHDFERSLRTEARFFNQSAISHLASLFDGVDKLFTRDKRPVIVKAGRPRNGKLCSARVFSNQMMSSRSHRRRPKSTTLTA
jgi:hypothetical protein